MGDGRRTTFAPSRGWPGTVHSAWCADATWRQMARTTMARAINDRATITNTQKEGPEGRKYENGDPAESSAHSCQTRSGVAALVEAVERYCSSASAKGRKLKRKTPARTSTAEGPKSVRRQAAQRMRRNRCQGMARISTRTRLREVRTARARADHEDACTMTACLRKWSEDAREMRSRAPITVSRHK